MIDPAMTGYPDEEAAARRHWVQGLGELVDALDGPEELGNAPVRLIDAGAEGLTLSPWLAVAAVAVVAVVAWRLLRK